LPRDSSWDEIYNGFKAKEDYFKWLNKHGYDDSKPRHAQMETRFEAFSWMGDVSADVLSATPNKVRFFANHVGCTANKNCRSAEQQRLSARSLGLRPILINHGKGEWKGEKTAGWSVDAEYDFNEAAGKHGVAGWGYLGDHELWEKIRKKEYPFAKGKVSIGEISRKSIVDSTGAKNVIGGTFYELSLLTDDVEPGDSAGYVEAIEAWSPIMEKHWETKLSEQEDKSGATTTDPLANVKPSLRNRLWTREKIDALPDSAFAKIAANGTKDSEGKTTPRSLRKYPYKAEDGNVDLFHFQSEYALAMSEKDDDAILHLEKVAKEAKIVPDTKQLEDAFGWALVEQTLYKLTERLAALEPLVTTKAEELVNAIVERHDLGKILNVFGPRFVGMEDKQDKQEARLKTLEECAGMMKGTGVGSSQRLVSESEAQGFRAKFDGVFERAYHVEHLPSQVSRQYLEDAIAADRKQTKSQIEKIR